MNGERIEPNGIVTQMKALYAEDGGFGVSAQKYRRDSDEVQKRLGLLEWRMRMAEEDNAPPAEKASQHIWVPQVHYHASAWMTGAEDTTLSVSPEDLNFTAGYTSSTKVLTYDTSADTITVVTKGLYTITLGARLKVKASSSASNNFVSAYVTVNGDSVGDVPSIYLEEYDIGSAASSTSAYIKLRECNSFDIALNHGDVIKAVVFGTDTSTIDAGRLTVRLVYPISEPIV
jgi:hypothetical protein